MSTFSTTPPLAVVIPAYRARFLADAVASIARQSNRRFHLYVGDDASPENLEPVVRAAAGPLPFTYVRFEPNLGRQDLVAHWERCIGMTRGEPWIWLFSDDDCAPPNAVAAFLDELENRPSATDLFRFNLDVVNASAEVVMHPTPHPRQESAAELARAFLTDRRRQWRVADHIFSRAVHDRCGGFINFPKALYADFATWILFSHPNGVRTLDCDRVLWRTHEAGTSSGLRGAHRAVLFDCLARLLVWTQRFAQESLGYDQATIRALTLDYFQREIRLSNPPLNMREITSLSRVAAQTFGGSATGHVARLTSVSLQTRLRYWPGFHALARWRYKRSLRQG